MANVDDGSDHVAYHESWHSSDYEWDDIRMAAVQKQRANDHDARPAFVNSPDGSDDWSADLRGSSPSRFDGGGAGLLTAGSFAEQFLSAASDKGVGRLAQQGGGGGGGALHAHAHAHAHARGVAVHVKPPPGSAAAGAALLGGYVEHSLSGRESPESHTPGSLLGSRGLFGMRAGENPTIYSSSRSGLSADSAFAVAAREDSASGGSNALLPNHNAGVGFKVGLCTHSLPGV
jgi:hypothetical protein